MVYPYIILYANCIKELIPVQYLDPKQDSLEWAIGQVEDWAKLQVRRESTSPRKHLIGETLEPGTNRGRKDHWNYY